MLDSAKCRSLGLGLGFGPSLCCRRKDWGASLGRGAAPAAGSCRSLVMSRRPVSSEYSTAFSSFALKHSLLLTKARGLSFDLQRRDPEGSPPRPRSQPCAEVTPAARPSAGSGSGLMECSTGSEVMQSSERRR